MRAAHTTGRSGAVRWFSSSMRDQVVSAATSVISTPVAAKNCFSVLAPSCRGWPSISTSFSLCFIQSTKGSAENQPPRSTNEKRWRPRSPSASRRAIQSSIFSSATSGTKGMLSSPSKLRIALW